MPLARFCASHTTRAPSKAVCRPLRRRMVTCKKNVGDAVVGNDETVALRDVEPFYASRDFDELKTGFFATLLRSTAPKSS